jgi:hypothetical protein
MLNLLGSICEHDSEPLVYMVWHFDCLVTVNFLG